MRSRNTKRTSMAGKKNWKQQPSSKRSAEIKVNLTLERKGAKVLTGLEVDESRGRSPRKTFARIRVHLRFLFLLRVCSRPFAVGVRSRRSRRSFRFSLTPPAVAFSSERSPFPNQLA